MAYSWHVLLSYQEIPPQILLYCYGYLNHYNNIHSFLHKMIIKAFLMGL